MYTSTAGNQHSLLLPVLFHYASVILRATQRGMDPEPAYNAVTKIKPLNRLLKPMLLAVLLAVCVCTARRSAFAPAADTNQTNQVTPDDTHQVQPVATAFPSAPPGMKATADPSTADPFAPFAVSSQLDIPLPDHLYAGGFEVRGSLVAPVNTKEKDLDFFTDSAFDKGENSGRLFSSTTSLYNQYLPSVPERSVAFICWRPLTPSDDNDGAMMAQLLPPREGYLVYEVTTDGKRLFVQFAPQYGTKNVGKPLDVYVWKGDQLGKGRFVPNDNKPFPKLRATLPKEYESERERGFEAMTALRPDEAAEAFKQAIYINPEDAPSYYGLGMALSRVSHSPESQKAPAVIAAFSRAVKLDPKYTEAWRERGVLYGTQKQWDKAIADATKVVALEPKDPVRFIERAQYYAAKGAHDKAAADALRAALLKPEEREYWEYLSLEQYHAGRYDAAVKSAHRALDQDDARNVARLVLAYIYGRRDQTEKAVQQIKEAQDNGVAYSEREDGLREIKKALKVRPKSAALHAIYRALSGTDHLEPDAE